MSKEVNPGIFGQTISDLEFELKSNSNKGICPKSTKLISQEAVQLVLHKYKPS